MAQPAPAPQIAPSSTIRIQNGVPDQDSVLIQVGEMVEFHNQDNTPYEIPISGNPLAGYLPAGGKFSFIGLSDATCEYTVASVSAEAVGGPPYVIVVGSGESEGDS